MYDVGPLPLWVDWYLWPATLAAPRDALLLSGRGEAGHRTLFASLDQHGRGPESTAGQAPLLDSLRDLLAATPGDDLVRAASPISSMRCPRSPMSNLIRADHLCVTGHPPSVPDRPSLSAK
ncbi:hypothetical protein [Paractinoplanes rishiriensis]|uniref:Uncharacterized protein n=1 Tax=Paractinoplanes rishiriensis TaxID=1050105 RepID=A0A919MW88_9ACTN|nr:hypothetical protein [Actinoplanes rishiriensis]GIE94415.1 hypothetical protein Ari01nite_18800 [Actinoplanes rishiriensis]